MERIIINKGKTEYLIEDIRPDSSSVLRIIFQESVPKKFGDITIFTAGGIECDTLVGYDTVYRNEGQTVYLSNDGSVYQLPEEPEEPPEPYEPTLTELLASLRLSKLSEVSTSCNRSIVSGCDVVLSDGSIGHYSLAETDQINLTSAVAMVQQGAAAYPYHADGELCRLYSAAEIVAIGEAATAHKFQHTTYCNHLNVWIRRTEELEDLRDIHYGSELPDDLAANMAAIVVAVSGVADETAV